MMDSRLFGILLSGVSLAALAAPAQAQDDQSAVSDEIVVTATGRSAAIQDVPIAVTAVTGETLELSGVTDVKDLQGLAPSYRFYQGQSAVAGTTAYIRGIGTGGDSPGFESAVGFFIDGVYRNRSGVALGDLPEVERIEVLRGPQGTLFGRNTSAGAISVITAGPDFDTHAWMSASVGDYDLLSGQAGITGALVEDVLAVRLDLSATQRDGIVRDVNTDRDFMDKDRWSGRAQALWDITPNASLRVIYDHAESNEQCCSAVTIAADPAPPAAGFPLIIEGLAGAIGLDGLVLPANPENRVGAYSPNRSYGETVEEDGGSAQLDWDLGFAELTSITSYRLWEATRSQDIDFAGHDRAYRDGFFNSFETTTQEIRLRGEAGMLDWLIGGFYALEHLDLTDTIRYGTQARLYADTLTAGQNVNVLPGPDGLTLFGPAGAAIAAFDGATGIPIFTPGTNVVQAAAALGAFQQVLAGGGSLALAQGTASATYTAPTVAGFAALLNAAAPAEGQGQNDNWATDTESFALFTHNEISLTDQLVLTLGARWNHEEKDMTADIISTAAACNVFRSAVGTPLQGVLQSALSSLIILGCNPAVNTESNGHHEDSTTENEWSGTASLAYHVTEDLMLYGGYSRGYKAGGYNIDRQGFLYTLNFCAPPTNLCTPTTPDASQLRFAPEFVDAFEIGWKWTLFDNTYFNGNIFLEQIEDYQINAFSGFNFITFNVPEAISKGVEIDVLTRPTDYLTIQAGLLYNDAYIDSTVVSPVGVTLVSQGDQFSQAPEWSGTAAVTYEYPIGDNLRLLFYVDGRYNSEYSTQTIGRNPITDNESYATFNARVGIGSEDGRWDLQAWVRNLTDEFYFLGGFAVPEQTSGGVGVYAAYPNEPRIWGVTLKARY